MNVLIWSNGSSCRTILRVCCNSIRLQNERNQLNRKRRILTHIFNLNRCLTSKRNKNNEQKDGQFETGSSKTKRLSKPDAYLNTKHYKLIIDYFNSKKCLQDVLPQIEGRYIKKGYQYPESQFIVDKEVAIEMIDAIKPELIKGDSHVFEMNPGPGVITEQLLLNDIKNLRLFENDPNFIANLNALVMLHKKKVPITRLNFPHLSTIIYKDQCDNGTRFDNIMNNIQRKNWDDSSPLVKLIGVISPTSSTKANLVKFLMYSIIFQYGIATYGRPELYVVIHPATYLQFTSNPSDGYIVYRSTSVLFQLLFESQLIMKIPRSAVIPWNLNCVNKRQSKLNQINSVDSDKMYFVKITSRSDLFSTIKPELLKPFWFFLRHHMMSRKNRVIPVLEHWIPGCGPRLIVEGLTIYTQFGDLSPKELLSVFLHFSSWPEFNSCPFLAAMEATILKYYSPGNEYGIEDEDTDGESVDDVDSMEEIQSTIKQK